jgi:hypothetical protein
MDNQKDEMGGRTSDDTCQCCHLRMPRTKLESSGIAIFVFCEFGGISILLSYRTSETEFYATRVGVIKKLEWLLHIFSSSRPPPMSGGLVLKRLNHPPQ